MNVIFIYALRDPRDGKVFYVGKTVMLWHRFLSHLRASRDSGLGKRIEGLHIAGFTPMLHVLEQCADNWAEREKFWIADFKSRGHILCNRHPGGNSRSPGFHQPISDDTRRKISETLKGRPLHPAFLARQKLVDKKHLEMMTAKAALVCRGRKWSDDVKKRISESNKKTSLLRDPERWRASGRAGARKQWQGMSRQERRKYAKLWNKKWRSQFIDITGEKFGRLTARWPVGKERFKQVLWLFQCDCGKLKICRSREVRTGNTRSCGCLLSEMLRCRNIAQCK